MRTEYEIREKIRNINAYMNKFGKTKNKLQLIEILNWILNEIEEIECPYCRTKKNEVCYWCNSKRLILKSDYQEYKDNLEYQRNQIIEEYCAF